MSATIAVVINLLFFGVLCVSIARFWRESRLGASSVRRLAALSSMVTLLIVLMIYSGEIRYNALLSLRYLGANEGLYESARTFLLHFDELFTDMANAINRVLGVEQVGYRPHPPLWPAVLLVAGYAVRFAIYRLHTRKGNVEAALTGAVYWSHITTYVMVLAYLIVIAGLPPTVVVPVSLVVLAVIVISVKLLIEDFGVGLRAAVKTIGTELSRAAGWVAYLATEIAGLVRDLLAYASDAYLEHVRKPLRGAVASLEKRNDAARESTKKRLADQNTRHAERFGEANSSEREPPRDR